MRAIVRGALALALPLVMPMAFAGAARAGAAPPVPAGWRLLDAESFDRHLDDAKVPWKPDGDGPSSPYNVDMYDNDGAFFDTVGGPAFRTQLAKMSTYRKSFTFGKRGWLTAELAARDADGDGRPDAPPTLTSRGGVARLDEPSHQAGVVIRSTRALPAEYRVEMTLRGLDFGGQRGGSWDYPDGRVNGYSPEGCKTNFPWASGGDFGRPECQWADVRTDSNGFYYMSIMDYGRVAPHNNVFIHGHRKVAMDGYNRYKYTGAGLRYCNPATGQYEPYSAGTGNGVNAIFMTDDRRYPTTPGTEYLMESRCGLAKGGAIVSTVDLKPELLPKEPYRFAVERRNGAYTMEMSGNFAHVGKATFRYTRSFVQDGEPIWHYNQKPSEYDGRYNADWTWKGPGGTLVDRDTWPAGSAYPDHFMIGDPHMNFYEGSARVDDVRLYTPR
ncbi:MULTISPECIES: hypothetical protein [Actinomadura]|uniref:Uncharacterized protein n=1 Tax=Actinomadura litoris TaxID=2678616 RepID=A0A7K1KYB7_9ACTN|nr:MULTISPECIES: hypothetical protein [Actinomadura]MBT2212308.1 hypothetical protein [Actinomadura sp. NEAU-AAG7]MUN37200.1 hypothetical protein [Actinomadura litoris]